MSFSVVVVNWNSIDDLRECLESLRDQIHRDIEVIVVDNNSSDGSAKMIASEYRDFKLLRQNENLGFAEACNRGIQASTGDWVCLLYTSDAADEEDSVD